MWTPSLNEGKWVSLLGFSLTSGVGNTPYQVKHAALGSVGLKVCSVLFQCFMRYQIHFQGLKKRVSETLPKLQPKTGGANGANAPLTPRLYGPEDNCLCLNKKALIGAGYEVKPIFY